MFSGKINQNACKLTPIELQTGVWGEINQNACKLTQIAFKLSESVQTGVFRQYDSICAQTDSNCVYTATNRANRSFKAKSF
jgi:pyruvate/2-oxoacid:ferredoxin oxidoreductase alpha subunit